MTALKVASYVGATLTLLTLLCSLAFSAWFAIARHHVGGSLCLLAIAVIDALFVAWHDWPLIWKPLFVKPETQAKP